MTIKTNPYVPTDFPLEMRDLLIKIDGRTEGIEKTLGEIKAQNANMEERLRKVENEQNVREGLKERYLATEKSVGEIDKRLHTIETTAKTGASVADWVWRVAPILVTAIFAVATFMANNAAEHKPKAVPAAVVQQANPHAR